MLREQQREEVDIGDCDYMLWSEFFRVVKK